ncbi:unnamed protein product [Parnassius apollo]|uniref:(apollo) hypothetical protein n=1 Tax=Parnassius apollo TaxID=110799 RepID=A0A8S3WML0_PARAO|nr:unnamed protein product [Parnassius apollo]
MSNWRANNDPLADFIDMLYADDDEDLSEDSEFEPDADEKTWYTTALAYFVIMLTYK